MTDRLDTTRSYRAVDRLLTKPEGDELLAYDPRSMLIHEFNESLAFVFGLCDGERPCEEMVIEVMRRYGLEVDAASKETYRALKHLVGDSLIEPL